MAEDLLPTVIPGMVGLENKKTGKVTNHFPVDAREIMAISSGEYKLVDNGAVEAARLNANPLRALENDRSNMVAEVTGIEGQVLVAMSAEEAEAWRERGNISGSKDVVTGEPKTGETPATDEEKKAAADAAKAKEAAAAKTVAAATNKAQVATSTAPTK